jgi:hypothetical protein
MLARKFRQQGPCDGLRLLFGRISIHGMRSGGLWQLPAICFHHRNFAVIRTTIWSDCWQRPVCAVSLVCDLSGPIHT